MLRTDIHRLKSLEFQISNPDKLISIFFTSPQTFSSNCESKLSVTRKNIKQAMEAKRIYFSLTLSYITRSESPKLVACHQIDCKDKGVTQDITFSSPSR